MNETKTISVAEIIYLCYFAVMLGAKAIGLYEGQTAYNVCLVIGAGFFALKLITTKHSLMELAAAALLMALGFVVYLQSGEKSLLILFTMMLGMKNVSVERVFKVGTAIWLTAFVGMYVLSVIGVIPEKAYAINRSGWPPILRHTLGYPHPNTLHVTYLILTIFVLYSCKNLSVKYIKAISVIMMLGNCYVFMYSLSRNGFLITTIYLFLVLYFVSRKERTKPENILIQLIFPLSAVIMIILPLVTKGALFDRLNRIVAGRFKFTRHFLTYQPLELFGIREIPVPEPAYVIDSSYIYLLVRLGIVAFILYFIAMLFLVNYCVRKDKRHELAVILALTIGGINETYLFNQSFKNLIFLFMGCGFYLLMHVAASKKESLFTREVIGLGIGEKKLRLKERSNSYSGRIPVNIYAFAALLLVVAGILTSIIYMIVVPRPAYIYLPEAEAGMEKDCAEYLTADEVRLLRHEGIIVRGYIDENTPMYHAPRRAVALVEYIRYIFSFGLWGGSIAALVCLLTFVSRSKVRYFLRNRHIGADYKENVLIVHNYYRIPGGEDVVVANEKALLEKNGHKVILYTRNNAEAGDHNFWQKIGLAIVSVFNIRTYREICRIIDREKIDIVHVHNTVALISPAVYIAGINRGIPVIQTVHNFRLVCPNGVCYIKDHVCERCLEHGLKASLLYNCYRGSKLQTFVCGLTMHFQRLLLTYRYINFICLTEFNKSKIMTLKQIREENVFIKPNFTTLDAKVLPYSQRKNQIVYAGRIEKIKGVDLLLQAWMKLGNNAPKLIICGSGELENWCREYIQNNEIENVEMLGQIPNARVKELVGESKAIIYPTQWYEGFPMAVAEAYTMGTPIIASDIGNVGNLVEDGVTGLKFKSNSVVSIAKAVEKFSAMNIELPKEYLTKYTADYNYVILKNIYESVRRKNEG